MITEDDGMCLDEQIGTERSGKRHLGCGVPFFIIVSFSFDDEEPWGPVLVHGGGEQYVEGSGSI